MLSVDTDGATRLVSTLGAAATALADLEPVTETAGDLVLGAARVPRDKGTLGASLGSVGGVVTATARHARFVHWGTRRMRARPFLTTAADAQADAIADLYTDHAAAALNLIEGT